MNLNSATVVTPTHRFEKARVQVVDGVIEIRDKARRLIEAGTAHGTLTDNGPGAWQFTTTDGHRWSIERSSGCGCGQTVVTVL